MRCLKSLVSISSSASRPLATLMSMGGSLPSESTASMHTAVVTPTPGSFVAIARYFATSDELIRACLMRSLADAAIRAKDVSGTGGTRFFAASTDATLEMLSNRLRSSD